MKPFDLHIFNIYLMIAYRKERKAPSRRKSYIDVRVKSTSDWISLNGEVPPERSSISEQTFNSRLHYFRGARTGRLPLVSASASRLARMHTSIHACTSAEQFWTRSNHSEPPRRNNRDFTPRGPLRFSQ